MEVHVAKGPALAHDHERPYNMLKREDGLADESYKADVRDPAYLEAMAFVNNLCARDRALPPVLHRSGFEEPAVLPQPLRVPPPRQAG